MDIEGILNQLILERSKVALKTALEQVQMLFGQLEPHVADETLESLQASFEERIRKDLAGE